MNMIDSRKDLMPQEGVKLKAGFAYFLTNCPTSSCLLVWSCFPRDSQESLPAPQFESNKEIKPVSFRGNQPWILFGRTDAKTPMLWPTDVNSWLIVKRPWFWERLRAGREGGDRGWDGWMASLTRWTGVWANSRRWWRTGKPGMLQSMGLWRVGHNLVTAQPPVC